MDGKSILDRYKEQYAIDKLNENSDLPDGINEDSGIDIEGYRSALDSMRRDMDASIKDMVNSAKVKSDEKVPDVVDLNEVNYKRFKDEYEKITEDKLDEGGFTRIEGMNAVIKRAFCPVCGMEIKSTMPLMINPYTMERIARYDCPCGHKMNLDHAYPRLVFMNGLHEEIKVYTD